MAKSLKKKKVHKLRPPIVTVLGHVDHGKTSILDRIRKTNIVSREVGGITQSIGASLVKRPDGTEITFIDTPGHEAFAKMRSRGAKLADIAILVVASDDGVKPQTKEALNSIEAAKIPYIVAITKIDIGKPDIKSIQIQLEKEGIKFEGKGGDVPLVTVSSKTGQGIDELLEMISLVSEVNEIKGDPDAKLQAVIIETTKDKKGSFASIVVRDGSLKVGDEVVAEGISCKIKGLFNDIGESIQSVEPGYPAQVLGFADLPPVGSIVQNREVDEEGKQSTQKWHTTSTSRQIIKDTSDTKNQINVVIKANSAGSLEAILAGLPLDAVVIDSGVGDVGESDLFIAKSASLSGGTELETYIFVLGSKISKNVANLAKDEGIILESFEIIYKLFDRVNEIFKEMQTEYSGKAEILASFPFNNKKVAGAKVISGKIGKGDKFILTRSEKEIGKMRAVTIRKDKKEVSIVKEGEEFGVIFRPQLAFEVGDVILSVRK